ncbi:MAG TPA: NrsF family protein [Polyangiaceae bacterium]|jgi:hypothetical protein
MSRDLDLERLAEIPDPFGGAARPVAAAPPMPAGSPTRRDVRRRRAVAAAAVLVYEVGWLLVVEHRADLSELPGTSIAIGLLLPLVAAAVALVGCRVPGRRGLGAPVAWLLSLCVLPAALFALGTLATSPPDTEGHFWSLVVRCMGVTALLTAGPLALGGLVFRRAFAAASQWRTAALGAACGAIAAATMSLACRHSGALHVILGHGAMILVGGAVGALVLGRVTRA